MSVIIRLQNLPWTANALDVRKFFVGLSVPDGGVHIVGGSNGDAFIAFSSDEDARKAMMLDNNRISGMPVHLLLSSKSEMQNVIAVARSAAAGAPAPVPENNFGRPKPAPGPANTMGNTAYNFPNRNQFGVARPGEGVPYGSADNQMSQDKRPGYSHMPPHMDPLQDRKPAGIGGHEQMNRFDDPMGSGQGMGAIPGGYRPPPGPQGPRGPIAQQPPHHAAPGGTSGQWGQPTYGSPSGFGRGEFSSRESDRRDEQAQKRPGFMGGVGEPSGIGRDMGPSGRGFEGNRGFNRPDPMRGPHLKEDIHRGAPGPDKWRDERTAAQGHDQWRTGPTGQGDRPVGERPLGRDDWRDERRGARPGPPGSSSQWRDGFPTPEVPPKREEESPVGRPNLMGQPGWKDGPPMRERWKEEPMDWDDRERAAPGHPVQKEGRTGPMYAPQKEGLPIHEAWKKDRDDGPPSREPWRSGPPGTDEPWREGYPGHGGRGGAPRGMDDFGNGAPPRDNDFRGRIDERRDMPRQEGLLQPRFDDMRDSAMRPGNRFEGRFEESRDFPGKQQDRGLGRMDERRDLMARAQDRRDEAVRQPDWRTGQPRTEERRPGLLSTPDEHRIGLTPQDERKDNYGRTMDRRGVEERRGEFGRTDERRGDAGRPGDRRNDFGRSDERMLDLGRPGDRLHSSGLQGDNGVNFGKLDDRRADMGRPDDRRLSSREDWRGGPSRVDNWRGGPEERPSGPDAWRHTSDNRRPGPQKQEDKRVVDLRQDDRRGSRSDDRKDSPLRIEDRRGTPRQESSRDNISDSKKGSPMGWRGESPRDARGERRDRSGTRHGDADRDSRDSNRDSTRGRKRTREELLYVYIYNMPTSISFKDVRRFFTNCNIPREGIKLINDRRGNRTGTGYIKFMSERDYHTASRSDNTMMSGRRVRVERTDQATFDRAVDSYTPRRSASPFRRRSSQSPPRKKLTDELEVNDTCIVMKNLASKVVEKDIRNFFSSLDVAVGNSVVLEVDSTGKSTGNACVAFKNRNSCREAVAYNKKELLGKPVEIKPSTKKDFEVKLSNYLKAQDRKRKAELEARPIKKEEVESGRIATEKTSPAEIHKPPKTESTPTSETPKLFCVRLDGLPTIVDATMLRGFFRGLNISSRGINVVTTSDGKAAGTAFVEFVTASDCSKAAEKNGQTIDQRTIMVKSVTRKEMEEQLKEELESVKQMGTRASYQSASNVTPLMGRLAPRTPTVGQSSRPPAPGPNSRTPISQASRPVTSPNNARSAPPPQNHRQPQSQGARSPLLPSSRSMPGQSTRPPVLSMAPSANPRPSSYSVQKPGAPGRPGCVLGIDKLPYGTTAANVVDFFRDYYPVEDSARIYPGNNQGEAFIAFADPQSAEMAYTELNRRRWMGRPVTIFFP